MRFPKPVHFLTLASLVLTGCELSDNAKRSADNSKRAADNSSDLLDLNQNAYGDGRQGGARDRREKALDSMIRATSLEAKLASAAAYYSALEYQLWKDEAFREDDEAKRARLITEGVSELLKIQKDFARPDLELVAKEVEAEDGKTTVSVRRNLVEFLGVPEYRDLFALAGAMQKISERQLEAAKRYGFKAKSMVDVLGEALVASPSAAADPNALSNHPAYVYESLRELEDVALLFEMRVNLFAGTALRAIGAPVGQRDGRLVITANAVQLQDASDRLKLAAQSAQLLALAGRAPRVFADVEGGLAKLVAGLNAIPKGGLESAKSPNLPKLLEVKALAERLLPKKN